MEHDNLDKAIQDLKDSVNKIGTDKIETFFLENYPEGWAKLTEEKKQSISKELQDFLGHPKNEGKIRRVKEMLERLQDTEFNIGILFLGVLLGVIGNLVANTLDRYFVRYGLVYNLVIAIIFFFFFWYIDRIFIKKTKKEIKINKTATDLLTILDKIERE